MLRSFSHVKVALTLKGNHLQLLPDQYQMASDPILFFIHLLDQNSSQF